MYWVTSPGIFIVKWLHFDLQVFLNPISSLGNKFPSLYCGRYYSTVPVLGLTSLMRWCTYYEYCRECNLVYYKFIFNSIQFNLIRFNSINLIQILFIIIIILFLLIINIYVFFSGECYCTVTRVIEYGNSFGIYSYNSNP